MAFPPHVSGVVLIVSLVAAACASPTTPASVSETMAPAAPRARMHITAAIMSDPRGILERDSLASLAGEGVDVLVDAIHAGLSITDDRGELRPQLAQEVPSLENGLWKLLPDGRMETTWKLRPNATWHDGTPFTAEDLVFTVVVHQDRTLPAARVRTFELVESAQAVDASTLLVRWKSPFIEADDLFSRHHGLPMPRHILEKPYLEDKATLPDLPYWSEEFIGTGAYRIREWVRGSHILLEANEQYVLGRPRVATIDVKLITDANTLVANALAGTVHLSLGRGLSLEQAISAREQWREGQVGIAFSSWIAIYPQLLNPTPPVVADVRFRKALMHALNRQEMVETFMAGLVPVAHTFISPSRPELKAVESSLVRYDYDPQRAIQMLEALGYSRGADGVFRDGSQQRLAFEVRAPRNLDIQVKSLLSVVDSWQRIGLGVESLVTPTAQQMERDFRANYPAFEIVRQPNELSFYAVTRYHPSESTLPENNYVGTNRTRYRNPEWASALDRWMSTIPRTERTQALEQVVRHMSDQLNIMGLFYDTEPTLIANRVKNVIPNAKELATTPAWNAHEWDVQ